jgi:hypothetical protein
MRAKTNKIYFVVNTALILTSAILYFFGLLSVTSVFTEALSFPFPVSSKFTLGGEINLIMGVISFVLSQALYLFFYEKNRKVLGVTNGKVLFYSLIGPLSSGVILIRKRSVLSQASDTSFFIKNTRSASVVNRIAGIVISLGALSFLFVLLFKMILFETYPHKYTVLKMSNNERKAYRRLIQIGNAQKQYVETDWDKDGVCSYSLYLVNLWQTLDEKVFPVEINLIPKRLGYAMRRAYSLDGYFYVDIHTRSLGKDPGNPYKTLTADLDYCSEFAVAAFPEQYNKTGRLSFIMDQNGVIKSFELLKIKGDSEVGLFLLPAPEDFEKWRRLSSEDELVEFQSDTFTRED